MSKSSVGPHRGYRGAEPGPPAAETDTSPPCRPRRPNVTTSMVGLRNGHIRKNLTQNGEAQRYSWGTQKKKKNDEPQRYSWGTQKKKKNGEPQRYSWGTQKKKKKSTRPPGEAEAVKATSNLSWRPTRKQAGVQPDPPGSARPLCLSHWDGLGHQKHLLNSNGKTV